jgi:hypothetical protein
MRENVEPAHARNLVPVASMNRPQATRNRFVHALLACTVLTGAALAGGCADEDLGREDGVSSATAAVTASAPPVTPAMTYLAHLPADDHGEAVLAKLFANGSASYVPVGDGTGYPVLFHSIPELNWLASQLWGGKTFKVVSSEHHANGDPIVRLDNKIIETPAGALLNLFDAYVTRGPVGELSLGVNGRGETVAPPVGTLAPVPISFLKDAVQIDGKPSVILNYFDDKSLPIIRRILDEIREVDGVGCKGLYLGRAHARRCVSWNCGETPTVLVDFPEHASFDTRYEWGFWTYFLLNFGQPDGKCDLTAAVRTAQLQLAAEGVSTNLPALPAAQ